jgi:hypothetical protein
VGKETINEIIQKSLQLRSFYTFIYNCNYL